MIFVLCQYNPVCKQFAVSGRNCFIIQQDSVMNRCATMKAGKKANLKQLWKCEKHKNFMMWLNSGYNYSETSNILKTEFTLCCLMKCLPISSIPPWTAICHFHWAGNHSFHRLNLYLFHCIQASVPVSC